VRALGFIGLSEEGEPDERREVNCRDGEAAHPRGRVGIPRRIEYDARCDRPVTSDTSEGEHPEARHDRRARDPILDRPLNII
jgi:hypothetical protein